MQTLKGWTSLQKLSPPFRSSLPLQKKSSILPPSTDLLKSHDNKQSKYIILGYFGYFQRNYNKKIKVSSNPFLSIYLRTCIFLRLLCSPNLNGNRLSRWNSQNLPTVYFAWIVPGVRSYSGPYFPAFGLNTKRYSNLFIFGLNAGKYGPE